MAARTSEGPRRLSGETARQLKKKYLEEHLDLVQELIGEFSFLGAPQPFQYDKKDGSWGWKAAYRADVETDPDKNHMLRRHLRSRALWRHHTERERLIDTVYGLAQVVKQEAEEVFQKHKDKLQEAGKEREYTGDYLGAALWVALDMACGKNVEWWYRPGESQGVNYGAYRIGGSVPPGKADEVGKEHWRLACSLAQIRQMMDLASRWEQAKRHQDSICSIAKRLHQARDIFYPCKFCRHLWD